MMVRIVMILMIMKKRLFVKYQIMSNFTWYYYHNFVIQYKAMLIVLESGSS